MFPVTLYSGPNVLELVVVFVLVVVVFYRLHSHHTNIWIRTHWCLLLAAPIRFIATFYLSLAFATPR